MCAPTTLVHVTMPIIFILYFVLKLTVVFFFFVPSYSFSNFLPYLLLFFIFTSIFYIYVKNFLLLSPLRSFFSFLLSLSIPPTERVYIIFPKRKVILVKPFFKHWNTSKCVCPLYKNRVSPRKKMIFSFLLLLRFFFPTPLESFFVKIKRKKERKRGRKYIYKENIFVGFESPYTMPLSFQ